MTVSIWKFRPSPFRTRICILIVAIFGLVQLFFTRDRFTYFKPFDGPQSDTSHFFAKGEELRLFRESESQNAAPNASELVDIRRRLFESPSYSANGDKFAASNGMLVAVQVHNRPQFFSILVESLRVAKDIDMIDLVISHDVWSKEMDDITKSIDFCRVHQIYFPLSANFYVGEYPADSATDCAWNVARSKQADGNCTGWEDSYGHFREARIVNIKHHWWWKLNWIKQQFGRYNSLTLLEEDHAVTPDFLHISAILSRFAAEQNAQMGNGKFITTLGTYKFKMSQATDDWLSVVSASFDSGKHNMGMVLDKAVVEQITADDFAHTFCAYDDYNWDFSMFHTVLTRWKSLRVFYPLIPRVFHLGDNCGLHHKKGDCWGVDQSAFSSKVHANRVFLFPPKFAHLRRQQEIRRKKLKANGGWGDERDRTLCRLINNMTHPTHLLKARSQFLNPKA